MRADWETAFENCPPYGEGKGAYTQEDFTCMMEMERNMEALLHWLESERRRRTRSDPTDR